MLPVWADEPKESENPFGIQQETQPVADFEESIFLFEQGLNDNNNKPLSVYSGSNIGHFLQGGIQVTESSKKNTSQEADLVFKSKKKKIGELYIGNFPANSLTRGVIGAYSFYKKDKFGIRNEYMKNSYNEVLAKNSIIISPEIYLSKNITLRAFHSHTDQIKGSQEGVAVEYSLKNSKLKSEKIKKLRFELKATNAVSSKNQASQRYGFNTRYNF